MAFGDLTTILTLVGSYFGPIGTAVGALAGSLIEGNFQPELPTIQDALATGATEGDGMQRFIGNDVAVGGEVIWRGNQLNIPIKKDADHGKVQTGWGYFLPFAISCGRTLTQLPIVSVREIFADGKLIYWSFDAVEISGTDIAATLVSVNQYDPDTDTTTVIKTFLDLTTSSTDLSEMHTGGTSPNSGGGEVSIFSAALAELVVFSKTGTTIVAGFTGGAVANNGEWIAVSVSSNRVRLKHPTNATYGFISAAAGDAVTILQAATQHFKGSGVLEIHAGAVDQAASTLITSVEGAAQTPAYAGLTYLTFSQLGLGEFGNRVPSFRIRMRERLGTSMPSALHDILVGLGAEECEVDTDDAVGSFRGYSWREPKSIPDVLAPPLSAYNLVTQEKDLKLRISHRLAVTTTVVPTASLAAQSGTNSRPIPPMSIEHEDPKRLAAESTVSYLDPDIGLQPGTASVRRPGLSTNNILKVSWPLTLDKDEAKRISQRMLYSEEVVSERHAMQLPPSSLLTYESDLLTTTSGGRERSTLTTKVSRGSNYIMEVEGRREDQGLYANEAALAGVPLGTFGLPQAVGDQQLLLADIAPLEETAAVNPTLYYGAAREGDGAAWNGAEIHQSDDGGVTFFEINGSVGEAPGGLSVGTLATGPIGFWDLGTSLTVDVFSQQVPTSVTDQEVLSGSEGWWLVGGEIVGVVTWAAQGDGRYIGTRLLRGLMDTGAQVATHAAAEPVVQVRSLGNVYPKHYSTSAIGESRVYAATSIDGDPLLADQKTITFSGQSVRPFSGAYATGAIDVPAAGDVTISWTPRTRLPLWDVLGSQPFDDAETAEEYEVEVYDDAGHSNLLRTITSVASGAGSVISTAVEYAPTCLYDAADISGDGATAATLYLSIYQVGQFANQRSKPYTVTVNS